MTRRRRGYLRKTNVYYNAMIHVTPTEVFRPDAPRADMVWLACMQWVGIWTDDIVPTSPTCLACIVDAHKEC